MNDNTPIALGPIPTCPSKPCYDTILNVLGSQFKNMDILKLKYSFNRNDRQIDDLTLGEETSHPMKG
ncbi:hypothetical protein MTR_4g107520 [Medicago truncatula]|uniref:Uncharacterized protein n=1 Tax=Medicago truncatula TaxID=3880 RepID=A0A072US77_MEDTR|nr:hypothetical protein MTR_4g107520 [Medicago truncatula]